jgi:hypothetical protein
VEVQGTYIRPQTTRILQSRIIRVYIEALLFLQAYIHYYNTIIDQTITHNFYCCDSESLLKRIQRSLHRSWVKPSQCLASDFGKPSQCLASDFDLESGILDIIAALSISFRYLRVKSHQDDSNEVHLLPWAAQMNVHADSLATNYLDNYATPSKLVPFIPASQASLTINSKTITRQFATKDYDKQQTAQEYARNSWPGTPGLSILVDPSIGRYP